MFARGLNSEGEANSSRVQAYVLLMLFLSNIFDTGGALGIKYTSFAIACLCAVWARQTRRLTSSEIIFGLIFFVLWPSWALLNGIVRGADTELAVSHVTPFLFVIVTASLLPGIDRRLPIRIFVWSMFSLAIVVTVLFSLQYLWPENPVSSPVLQYLADQGYRFGFFGTRPGWESSVPNVYFGATLFLVPTCIYFLFQRRFVASAIVLVGLTLSFSKAGLLIVLGFLLFFLIQEVVLARTGISSRAPDLRKKALLVRAGPAVLLVGVLVLALSAFPEFAQDLSDSLRGESDTTAIRLNYATFVLHLFSDNPQYLLWGQGAGISGLAPGDSIEAHNELDHLNTVRKFGVPWFLVFTWFVFRVVVRLTRSREAELRAFGVSLFGIYLAAGTNPVLTSPLFMMLLISAYFAQRDEYGASQHSAFYLQRRAVPTGIAR